MEVEVELSRIIFNEKASQQIIVLKEIGGSRGFPIVIGTPEILAIDRRLKGLMAPRPMTHDLLDTVIRALGADIEKILISDLRDHTFFAEIYLNVDGNTVRIDSRPSDAIALGVASETPIFVADHVFDLTEE
jgi:bifunctional DNase/RNase